MQRTDDTTTPLVLCAPRTEPAETELVLPALSSAPLVAHFLVCLGRTPLGEVWKAQANDGRLKVVHFIERGAALQHGQAIERLLSLSHPALPPWQGVWCEAGQPALVADFLDHTLRDRFQQCWDGGLPGVPQAELLACLGAAAEALDSLYSAQQIQHLALTPENLALRAGQALLGQFGLAQLLWLPAGLAPTQCNPRYAAPELRRGHFSYRCDQYSLALIYAEMRTGVHPLRGRGRGRSEATAAEGPLDLRLLSAAEREVVARALCDQSHERFATCTDLVEALQQAARGQVDPLAHRLSLPPLLAFPTFSDSGLTIDRYLQELSACLLGETRVRQRHQLRYRLEPGVGLEHRCAVKPSFAALQRGLDIFRRRWRARVLEQDESKIVLSLQLGPALWQRLLGRRTGVTIQAQPFFPLGPDSPLGEVVVVIRPFGCVDAEAVRLLEEVGPLLLEDLRSCLEALPEHRTQERVRCDRLLRITPILAGSQLAEAIDGVGKDISVGGVGFLLREPLPTRDIYVRLPWLAELAEMAVRAEVVRGQPRSDGWYEVGAMFPTDG